MTNENNYSYLLKIYEKVSEDMAPKDGETYYYINRQNHTIIKESTLKEAFKKWKDNNEYNYNLIPESCKNCPNHPSNGGSGICHCILGNPQITC